MRSGARSPIDGRRASDLSRRRAGRYVVSAPTQPGAPAASVIVGFVGMPLGGSASRSAGLVREGRRSIEQVLDRYAVVNVGPSQQKGERDAAPVRDQLAFGARPASVGRVRTCSGPPFFSHDRRAVHEARPQWMRSASRSWQSSSWCRLCHTPLPVAQSPPAGHTRPAPHLRRQHLPRNASAQHEQDADQRGARRNMWSASLRLGQSR
jgi:hypothetical protein